MAPRHQLERGVADEEQGRAAQDLHAAATLAVVIVLLLVTYRSPVLWLLPVISAGVALTTAQGLIVAAVRLGRWSAPGREDAE